MAYAAEKLSFQKVYDNHERFHQEIPNTQKTSELSHLHPLPLPIILRIFLRFDQFGTLLEKTVFLRQENKKKLVISDEERLKRVEGGRDVEKLRREENMKSGCLKLFLSSEKDAKQQPKTMELRVFSSLVFFSKAIGGRGVLWQPLIR